MKVSIWRNLEEMTDSIDFEFDASNKDEVKEFEKYLEIYLCVVKNKETTDDDLIKMLKTQCLTITKE